MMKYRKLYLRSRKAQPWLLMIMTDDVMPKNDVKSEQ